MSRLMFATGQPVSRPASASRVIAAFFRVSAPSPCMAFIASVTALMNLAMESMSMRLAV